MRFDRELSSKIIRSQASFADFDPEKKALLSRIGEISVDCELVKNKNQAMGERRS
jgi:hypothetical protein